MAYNPHQHLTSHQHYQQQRQQQDLSAGSGGTLALLEASSSTTGLGGAPGAAAEYDAAAAMAAATAAAEEAKKNEPALRPFLCEECGSRYTRQEHLDRHVTAKHRGVKDFVCPTCGKGFARRDILRRHEQGHAAKAAAANGGPSASSKKASKVKDEDDDGDYNNAGSSRGKKAARKPEAQQQQQQQQQQQYASAVGTSKSAAAAPVLGANGKPTRISRACARCSRQKLKCDGLDPCARCAKAKQVCSYDRGGGPGDGGSGGHKRRSSAAHGRGGAHKRARTDDDVDVEPEDASTRSLSILSASDDTHANESSSVLAPSAGAEPSVSPWDHPYALPQQPQQQAYGGGGASEYPHGLSPYLSGSLPGANNTTANNNSGAQGEHPFYSQKILPPPFSASAAGQPIPASAAQRNAARLPHQANTPVGLLSRGPLPFSSSFLGSATTNGAGAAHAAAHLNARGGGGPFLPPPASTSHAGNARATQGWNRGPGQADFGAFDVDLGPDQPFMPGLSSTTSASAVPALSAALAASGAAASNGELFSLPFHMGGDPSMNVGTTPSGGAPAWNAEHAATGARYDFLSSIASAGEESASLAAQQQQHALPGGTPADSSYMNALWGSVFGIDLESAASASRSRATSPQLQAPPPPPPQPPQQQQPQPQVDKRQLSSKSILHTQPLEEASETSSSYAEDLSKSSSQSQSSGAQRHARNNRLRVSAVAQAVGGGDSRSVAESLLRLAARRPDANSPHDDDDSEHPWPLSSRPAGAAQHPQTTNIAKLDAARASPGENGTVPLPERDEHGHESEEEEGEDEDEEDEDEILSRELEKDVVAAVTDETRERVLGGVLETTTGLLSTRELSSFIPSTKLLNHFLQLYFARFHALYPIIHRPTFDTNGAATYLLLALASIGARYSSVPLAQGYAHALSECGQHMLKVVCQLNHVILHTVAWQQASILLLLAGLSAGNRRDLERAQYYANLPVTSCRRQGWLVDEEIDSDEEKHYTLEDRWRRWRDRETLKRLGFAALMLDGMGSTLWNLETSFLFDDAAFSRMPCLNALWEATTPDAWQSLFRGSTQPTPSLTTLEVVHLLTDRTHHNSDKITALAHEHFLMVLALTVLNLLGFAKRRETHMSVLYLPSTAQFDRLSAIQSPTQASLTTGLDFFDEKVLLPPEIYSTLSEAKSTATGMILYAYVTRLTERMPLRVLQLLVKTNPREEVEALPYLRLWATQGGGRVARETLYYAGQILGLCQISRRNDMFEAPGEPLTLFYACITILCFVRHCSSVATAAGKSPSASSATSASPVVVSSSAPRLCLDRLVDKTDEDVVDFLEHGAIGDVYLTELGPLAESQMRERLLRHVAALLFKMRVWKVGNLLGQTLLSMIEHEMPVHTHAPPTPEPAS